MNGSVRKETINYWKDICYDDVDWLDGAKEIFKERNCLFGRKSCVQPLQLILYIFVPFSFIYNVFYLFPDSFCYLIRKTGN